MTDRKDRTIFNNWILTGELSNFVLSQEGLTSLDDWGGKEVVREILPEDYQANFDMVQADLVNTVLKEKNKGSFRRCGGCKRKKDCFQHEYERACCC